MRLSSPCCRRPSLGQKEEPLNIPDLQTLNPCRPCPPCTNIGIAYNISVHSLCPCLPSSTLFIGYHCPSRQLWPQSQFFFTLRRIVSGILSRARGCINSGTGPAQLATLCLTLKDSRMPFTPTNMDANGFSRAINRMCLSALIYNPWFTVSFLPKPLTPPTRRSGMD